MAFLLPVAAVMSGSGLVAGATGYVVAYLTNKFVSDFEPRVVEPREVEPREVEPRPRVVIHEKEMNKISITEDNWYNPVFLEIRKKWAARRIQKMARVFLASWLAKRHEAAQRIQKMARVFLPRKEYKKLTGEFPPSGLSLQELLVTRDRLMAVKLMYLIDQNTKEEKPVEEKPVEEKPVEEKPVKKVITLTGEVIRPLHLNVDDTTIEELTLELYQKPFRSVLTGHAKQAIGRDTSPAWFGSRLQLQVCSSVDGLRPHRERIPDYTTIRYLVNEGHYTIYVDFTR